MAVPYWLIFLMYISGISVSLAIDSSPSGDELIVIPLSIYLCESSESIIDFDAKLRNINDDGDKELDAELNLESPFTEAWTGNTQIEKWNSGSWDNIHSIVGPACESLNEYIPRVWQKFRDAASPPMSGDCAIEPGSYKITNFAVQRAEYDIPANLFGKYRASTKIYDESGTEMACIMYEVEAARNNN